ncbi:ABC transporter transmembrane domain-containing protein [Phytohalomonas tamaricis]|uniref:ABC transporter transmembrane domain-containing protein n=1 Tax=Phytohalomonas tamaricis TaxID=2081032 RepID=UPI000D0BC6F5|nr:ABC transporter transmembrane domain-containing protein [Phytohalomonas tamaricis]
MLDRRLLALLLRPVIADRRRLLMALLILIGATALDVIGPWLTKYYLDSFLVPGDLRPTPLVILVTLYLVTQCLAALGRYLQTLSFARIALDAVLDIRKRLFRHVLHLPQHVHDATPVGEMISRVTNDTDALRELYVAFLATVLQNVVLLVGILIAMAVMDLRLMAVAAMLIPAALAVIWCYQRLSGPAAMEVRRLRAEQNTRINEAISGMTVLQSYNQIGRYSEHFHTINASQYQARMRTVRISGLFLRSAIDLIGVVILAGLLLGYGLDHLQGAGEIGVLYAFVTYLGRVSEPLIEITQRFNIFQQASVAGTRLLALFDQPQATLGGDSRPIVTPHYHLNELSFCHYGADKYTLHDVTLDIAPGSFIGVVGPTGSGKSTLLDLLSGLKPATSGTLILDNRPMASIAPATINDAVATVPQEPFIRSTTLRDNLLLDRDIDETALRQALDDAQLNDLIARLPEGLDTRLGERGLTLSTGERQLLALARALLRQPQILLLDEATASVDSATEKRLQRALEALRGRVTLIVVAHRLSTIRHADSIIVMAGGRIVEQGHHETLLTYRNGYYYRLWHHRIQAQA